MIRTALSEEDARLLLNYAEQSRDICGAVPMIPLILLYLWAALAVGLVLWLQAPRGAWRWNDLLAMSLCWPVGPVIYCLVKRNL